MQPFKPTHYLISQTRKIPVKVVSQGIHSQIYTEAEWGRATAPAFEVRSKLGIFCRGVQVVGHDLEPITIDTQRQKQTVSGAT
ncbi:hypothetical protein C7271_21100 [filamentous cyanobacterium CCP5]|nr:hypothetical protein C7271_21100 [filamentous cyanobacterium CCP5]